LFNRMLGTWVMLWSYPSSAAANPRGRTWERILGRTHPVGRPATARAVTSEP
jgi:hypothetical protein